jgi:hypothetical protein
MDLLIIDGGWWMVVWHGDFTTMLVISDATSLAGDEGVLSPNALCRLIFRFGEFLQVMARVFDL